MSARETTGDKIGRLCAEIAALGAGIVPPCPACVSEYGEPKADCPHCGGSGVCPSWQSPAIPQTDLQVDAAKILRDNAWDLYEGDAVPRTAPNEICQILDDIAAEIKTWAPQPSGEVWIDPRLTWLRKRIAELQRLTEMR